MLVLGLLGGDRSSGFLARRSSGTTRLSGGVTSLRGFGDLTRKVSEKGRVNKENGTYLGRREGLRVRVVDNLGGLGRRTSSLTLGKGGPVE